jgi:hypothetical protein
MAGDFLDLPPEQAATLKKTMNIDPGYSTAIVEDPGAQQLGEILRELGQLLGNAP